MPHWQTTFAPAEHLLLTPVPMLSAHTWYIWYIILHSLQNPLSCLQMSVWVDKIGWWNNLLSWFTNSLQDFMWFLGTTLSFFLYISALKLILVPTSNKVFGITAFKKANPLFILEAHHFKIFRNLKKERLYLPFKSFFVSSSFMHSPL